MINEWNSIKSYIRRTSWAILLIAASVFLCHGSLLFSERFGIDTEFIMSGVHNFNSLGRQGLVWLGQLLGLEWFNLYYAQALVILFLILAPISFGYLFWNASGKDVCVLPLFLLGLSFVISPFWTAQIYFLNQSPQVLFSCILIPIIISLAEKARSAFHRKWYYIVFAVAFMQPVFSCYQVLIMIYVTAIAAIFLLSAFKSKHTVREQLLWILYHASVFLCGFLIYLIISNLFFLDGTDYLQSQIWWNLMETSEAARLCLDTLRGLCGNNPPYTTGLYPYFALLLLILTFYQLYTGKRKWTGSAFLFILVELFIIAVPSVFILIYGGLIPDRMQLLLPFSQGCILYMITFMLPEKKNLTEASVKLWIRRGAALFLVVLLWKDFSAQLSYCNRLYYTDEWRYQYDKKLAGDIYSKLLALQNSGKYSSSLFLKTVFLGRPELPYNDTCMRGHVMGVSEFAFDAWEKTMYRPRIVYFMSQLGYPMEQYFSEDDEALFFESFQNDFGALVDAMPCYPSDNYIQVLSNEESGQEYLIIKLSEDWWGWD